MPTIGQKLEETRLSRGLSVGDVAHATRIHPNLILSIEEDDFSRFPSVAYAKSFIRKYGDHLGLDLSEATGALNSGVPRFGETEFLLETKRTFKKDQRFRLERFGKVPRLRPSRKRGRPLFLNLILGTLLAAIGIFYFLGYNAPSARKATEEIARGLGLPLSAPATDSGSPVETNPLKSSLPAGKEGVPSDSSARVNPSTSPAVKSSTNASTVALETPAPTGTPPVYPVLKEAVEVKLEEPPVDPAAKASSGFAAPRPRSTPTVDSSIEGLAPPPLSALPSLRPGGGTEPQPVLRPEAIDPAATARLQPETPRILIPSKPTQAEPVAAPD